MCSFLNEPASPDKQFPISKDDPQPSIDFGEMKTRCSPRGSYPDGKPSGGETLSMIVQGWLSPQSLM